MFEIHISGKQKVDPVRGSEVIIKAVESEDPPLRLLMVNLLLIWQMKKLIH